VDNISSVPFVRKEDDITISAVPKTARVFPGEMATHLNTANKYQTTRNI
jgi:hypothetical protein